MKNTWAKLVVVSLLGIVVSFGILWGVNEFNRYNYAKAMYGYNMNMNGMNIQGNMNIQGMNTMPMDNMQGGMGMMGGMKMNRRGMMGGMKLR